MKITDDFYLDEFTFSRTAERLNIANVPSHSEIECIKKLCINVLQPVRDRFGRVIVTSGFRCGELNKAIGGAPNSQHQSGKAADIKIMGMDEFVDHMIVARYIRDQLSFDQLILEYYKEKRPLSGYLHCSYNEGYNRGETLTTANGRNYHAGLIVI